MQDWFYCGMKIPTRESNARMDKVRADAAKQQEACRAVGMQAFAELDSDLAAPWRELPPERWTQLELATRVQQIRLLRQLLEKLNDGDKGSQEGGNG